MIAVSTAPSATLYAFPLLKQYCGQSGSQFRATFSGDNIYNITIFINIYVVEYYIIDNINIYKVLLFVYSIKEMVSQLQFGTNGSLIIPPLIQKDKEEEQLAKAEGMSLAEYKFIQSGRDLLARRRMEFIHGDMSGQQKLSDGDLIELHAKGFSDADIAKVAGCSRSAVLVRREKLALVANFKPNLSEPELLESYDRRLDNKKQRAYFKRHARTREGSGLSTDMATDGFNDHPAHYSHPVSAVIDDRSTEPAYLTA